MWPGGARFRRCFEVAVVATAVALTAVPIAAQASSTQARPTTISTGDVAPPDQSARPNIPVLDRTGIYVYVPDSGQGQMIDRAVNRAVAHMLPIIRGFARRRLTNTNKLPDTLRLIVEADTLGTQTDHDKPMDLPRDGRSIRWQDGSGDVCRARDSATADTLLQYCAVGTAASVARYVVMDGGRRLRMIIHVTSPDLSGPLDYTIDFRRAD